MEVVLARLVLVGTLAHSRFLGAQGLNQERVLVVTRHGIRVPFPPLAGLAWEAYSLDPDRDFFTDFSDWGADQVAGLTVHGQRVIRAMGAYFRSTVMNNTNGSFTIYSAVDKTKRDIKTAISFFQGAFPETMVTEQDIYGPRSSDEQEYVRVLLNQGDFSAGPMCPSSAGMQEVIAGEIGGDFAMLSAEQQQNIEQVNDAFECCRPSLCEQQGNLSFGSKCTLMSLPTKWEGQKFYWEDFTGPVAVAAKLVEYVQLLYLNGMDYKRVVPSMSEEQIASLMRLHEESMGIADDYWNSRNAASELFVHMAATMQQAVRSESVTGLHSRASDSLVYYAAHDINIYLLRRLLRLNWLTSSYNPNQSPPGGMLLLVLYSSADGAKKNYFVKAFFMSQSMQQQRNGSPLSAANPASRVFAIIPGCADGPELSCPFEDFKKLVLKEIKRQCVRLVDPDVLAVTSKDSLFGQWWIYCLIAVSSLLVGIGLGAIMVLKCRQFSSRGRIVVDSGISTSLAHATA